MNRTSLAVTTALVLFAAFFCMTAPRAFGAPVPQQDGASPRPAIATGADHSVDSALCQIVYQVDRREDSLDGFRYIFYGNGFFINKDGYVLTAAHVLTELNGGQPYLLIGGAAGHPRFLEAEVVTIDPDHDVALLRATTNPFKRDYGVSFLPLATAPPSPGDAVVAAALRPVEPRNSYTSEPIIEDRSAGTVLDFEFSQFDTAQTETELFVFTHPVQPGQSGAAVISPDSHAVLGLVEGEWLRGALTALAAAKHAPASDDSDSLMVAQSEGNQSPIPGAVIPIHYAIALLQQNGIAWQAAPRDKNNADVKAVPAASDNAHSDLPAPLSLVPAPFPSQSFFGGEVLLDAAVDHTGTLSDVRVVHGDAPFLERALGAVRTWMFVPPGAGTDAAEKRIAVAFEFPQPYIPPRAPTVHQHDDASTFVSDESAPIALTTAEPEYPDRSGKSASVILYAAIDSNGQVGSVQVLRGAAGFSDAAVAAVHRWKFAAARRNGAAVDSAAIVVVTFRQPLVISHSD